MTKRLHTALLALLGLSVLAGCRQANPEDFSGEAQQVTAGPVNVSVDLSLKGFGEDNTLTKGEFYDPTQDFIEVNDSLFYDHEKIIKDALIFVFDAENAFKDDGAGKYKFDPTAAECISTVNHEYIDQRDTLTRIQFKLDKPYKSLAVLVLANYQLPSSSYTLSGKLADIVTNLAGEAKSITFSPDQDRYHDNGIPMHGWKVFGSLEGLSSSLALDSDAAKKCRLRYYKGMTTPLTVVGFEDPARLEEYAKESTGKGVVNQEDHVQMEFALSRLQLRYEPKKDAIKRDDPATPEVDSVRVSSVKLNVYKNKFRMVPDWFGPTGRPNPYSTSKYDTGDFVSADVTFKEIPSKSGNSKAFVAYVPEISAASVTDAITADPTGFKEPSLEVKVEVKVREKTDGSVVTYTYARNKITVDDGTNPPRDYNNYGDEGWVSWLKFKTNQVREDKDGNDINIGTRFGLVRHYSYEWLAVGINE